MSTSRALVVAACSAFLVASACGDSSGPGDGNIPAADVPRTATGGDPRGTYAPNAPLLQLFGLPAGVRVDFTRNGGSGAIEFQGGSATEGTYAARDLRIDLAGTLTALGQTFPIDSDAFDDAGPLRGGSGTWRVIGTGRLQLGAAGEPPDTVGYTATERGLFFVEAEPLAPGQTSTIVLAFRRR
jgi:hypothetical protein